MNQNFNDLFKEIPQEKEESGKLLIEPILSNITLHQLCIYASLIKKSKGLSPIFLLSEEAEAKLSGNIKNYFDEFEVLRTPSISSFHKLCYILISFFFFISNIFNRNLLKFKWKGIHFGDLVYDTFLINSACATNHPTSIHNWKTFYLFFKRFYIYEKAIELSKPKATLVSHMVGINSGVLFRIGAKKGADIFLTAGQDYGTLICTPASQDSVLYPYSATPKDLSPILSLDKNDIEAMYNKVKDKHLSGSFNADAALAFSKRYFTTRKEFSDEYKTDPNKKNIFIMLHATTDYPHSHFNGMLFNDYFDWFYQTLQIIKDVKDVNWIIKQHPSILFYPTKDVNFNTLMKDFECDHIKWLNEESDFDSRSIIHVGDAIITCCGSAGFEFAAFNKIPCLTAGDSPYAQAKFAITPKNKNEYFEQLKNMSSLEKIEDENHKWAMATYTFIHRLSKVRMSAVPALSHQELVDYSTDNSYFTLVSNLLVDNKNQIKNEFLDYIQLMKSKDFTALRTNPNSFLTEKL